MGLKNWWENLLNKLAEKNEENPPRSCHDSAETGNNSRNKSSNSSSCH